MGKTGSELLFRAHPFLHFANLALALNRTLKSTSKLQLKHSSIKRNDHLPNRNRFIDKFLNQRNVQLATR